MIRGILKTLIWWIIIIVIVIFFLQGNVIDSPRAFVEWAQATAEGARSFFDSTFGQLDLNQINLNGEEIDVPQESD